jgi:hypothetical protein
LRYVTVEHFLKTVELTLRDVTTGFESISEDGGTCTIHQRLLRHTLAGISIGGVIPLIIAAKQNPRVVWIRSRVKQTHPRSEAKP